MPSRLSRHAYKEIRLQQLRSFGGTARPGSLTAAAAALRLSQPTVCEQVHARERASHGKLIVVTPRDHPLARRRRLLPRDLLGFPLVNAPDSIPDPAVAGALENLGVFQTQPRQVEAYYTAVIRRFVEMGFGIGLVLGLPSR